MSTTLALDIGNTAVTYGIYRNGSLTSFGSRLFVDIPKLVKKCIHSGKSNGLDIVISSVVPKNTSIILKFISAPKGIKIWVVGKNLPIQIRSAYQSKGLGIDRLVTAYGALRQYGAPVLVIDYGTAVTFDYLSKSGRFEGGLIIPGPQIAFQSLIRQAALLPKNMRLPVKAGSLLGKTTYECMKSGVLQGYGAMTDDLIERFRHRYGKMKVVATGGFSVHLKPYVRRVGTFDPKLSIKSLYRIFLDRPKH